MKKVLYISNIEVPYRSDFFNRLSQKIDLTVLYERKNSSNRDEKWAHSVKATYKIKYLKGINIKNEYTFDLGILEYIFSRKYDKIIIGCFNSPSQMLAILMMKIFHKKYILNLDGESFLNGNSIKQKIKRFFIKGAEEYLVAGEKSGKNLAKFVPKEKVHIYYLSSLTKKQLEENAKHENKNISNKVIVVGQYFKYKGLDIALECAKLDKSIEYKFIGSGKKSYLLEDKVKKMKINNVEIIPFLEKEELYKEYQTCKCLLLPSLQECWGLVVIEAASFGCPIVATNGSGAALELLDNCANINEPNKLVELIKHIDSFQKKEIIKKISRYSIEESVRCTVELLI